MTATAPSEFVGTLAKAAIPIQATFAKAMIFGRWWRERAEAALPHRSIPRAPF